MWFLDGVRAAVRRAASRRDPWPPLERMVDGVALRVELRRIVDGLPTSEDGARLAACWSGNALEQFLEWLLPQLLSLDLGQPAGELQRIVLACLHAFVAETRVGFQFEVSMADGTILIVEDEPQFVELYRRWFTERAASRTPDERDHHIRQLWSELPEHPGFRRPPERAQR